MPGAKPSVCELVKLGAANKQADPVAWAGSGELTFFPSQLEEHMPLAPKEVLGAYWFRNGYTFDHRVSYRDVEKAIREIKEHPENVCKIIICFDN